MASYKGKSMRIGGGGRFKKMVDAMKGKGMGEEKAAAVAAKAGRAKYGKMRFAAMAASGRKRAGK